MTMNHFQHRFRVHAPVAKVSEFHQDPRALKSLTPPPVFVQLHRAEPLAEGSKVDFTLWLGPLPVRWVAVHSLVDPKHGFSDTQLIGPFKLWFHRHSFMPIDAHTTEVVDEIEAAHTNHLLWGLISRLMWLNLPILFWYRARLTRRKIESAAP
jgi:ligand-binding SRPBCC domain-containing protein